jgi:hypothetical protein
MNWTEDDIDQLFKDSANQMNVPFQESYWTEMEALLPQTKKKKGLGWIFGGTIACLALISTFFFPENGVESKDNVNQTAINQPNKTEKFVAQTTSVTLKNQPQEIIQITDNQSKSNKDKSISTNRQFNKFQSLASSEVLDGSEQIGDVSHKFKKEENEVAVPIQSADYELVSMQKLPVTPIFMQENFLISSNFKNNFSKRKSHSMFLQIGAGLTESHMQTSEGNWMPTINIGAGYQYSPQGLGFSAGLNLNTSFSDNLEINRKSKVYNFGSTNYEQNFIYKQIYTLELPVSVDFRKNRQTFSLGIAPTFIAGSLMRFSQLENGNLSQDEYYIGQKVGLNHFGLKPSLAYQLELAKGWNVGIQLSTQLMNQVDDSQFIGTNRNNPLSGQITIRKTIIKF